MNYVSNEPSWEGLGVDAFCALLRANDPQINNVYRTFRHSRAIGEALLGNAHVSILVVNLSDLYAEYATNTMEDHPLLRCVRDNPALERLFLDCSTPPLEHVGEFLDNGDHNPEYEVMSATNRLASYFYRALQESTVSNVFELWVSKWEDADSFDDGFRKLVASTTKLQRLTVDLPDDLLPYERFQAVLGRVLVQNSTLVYLCLGSAHGETSYRVHGREAVRAIRGTLQCLGQHATLCELVIRCPGPATEIVTGVAFVLHQLPLRHLELEYMMFDVASMECLVEGLQVSATLETLLFNDIPMNRDASKILVDFLWTAASRLSKLRFSGHLGLLSESLVTVQRPNHGLDPFHSVGSMLRTLEFGASTQDRDVAQFLNFLGQHATAIRLSSLQLYCFQTDEVDEALLQCVPRLIHLTELKIEKVWSESLPRPERLVQAVRRNGSLHGVHISHYGHDASVQSFTDTIMIRMESYCQRNEYATQRVVEALDAHARHGSEAAMVTVPLFLLASAYATRTAPTALLTGLIAGLDFLGPRDASRSL